MVDVVGREHRLALDPRCAVSGLQHDRHVLTERLKQPGQPRRLDHPRGDEVAITREQIALVECRLTVGPRRVGDVAERLAAGKHADCQPWPQNPSSLRTPWRRIRSPLPVNVLLGPAPTVTDPRGAKQLLVAGSAHQVALDGGLDLLAGIRAARRPESTAAQPSSPQR